MAALETPVCNFGEPIINFELLGVDERRWKQTELMGEKGLLIAFICNHCPFVKAVQSRLVRDAVELQALGVNFVAINANDAEQYPEDSFENMKKTAELHAYPFPYLYDETQAVAKAYGAVCTPDFFGYNAAGELQYRGRLDASGRFESEEEKPRDLFNAMKQVAETGKGPEEQFVSIGCSIKWR